MFSICRSYYKTARSVLSKYSEAKYPKIFPDMSKSEVLHMLCGEIFILKSAVCFFSRPE